LETLKKEVIATLFNTEDTISIFTSPSTFQAFYKLYDAHKTTLGSIGTTTSEFIISQEFIPKIIASEQTYEGISQAIINHYETKNIRI
jgi:uroporphyrinogen-III synthase